MGALPLVCWSSGAGLTQDHGLCVHTWGAWTPFPGEEAVQGEGGVGPWKACPQALQDVAQTPGRCSWGPGHPGALPTPDTPRGATVFISRTPPPGASAQPGPPRDLGAAVANARWVAQLL